MYYSLSNLIKVLSLEPEIFNRIFPLTEVNHKIQGIHQ